LPSDPVNGGEDGAFSRNKEDIVDINYMILNP